jgi:hypothetical protein
MSRSGESAVIDITERQFRLAAHLEAEAERLAVAVHLFDHQALLVHLDGEHRGVAVLVVVLGDGLRERRRAGV